MATFGGMLCCVPGRRTVATSDVPALRAPAQMKPPAAIGETFCATDAVWLCIGVDTAGKFPHSREPQADSEPDQTAFGIAISCVFDTPLSDCLIPVCKTPAVETELLHNFSATTA
jgi:hypothetical protein